MLDHRNGSCEKSLNEGAARCIHCRLFWLHSLLCVPQADSCKIQTSACISQVYRAIIPSTKVHQEYSRLDKTVSPVVLITLVRKYTYSEYVYERTGFGFTSGWLTRWRESFQPIPERSKT